MKRTVFAFVVMLSACATTPDSTPDFGRILNAIAAGAAARQQAIDQQRQNMPAPPTVCRWIGPNWVCQ